MALSSASRIRIGHVKITRIEEADPKPTPGFLGGITRESFEAHRESIDPSWYTEDGAPLLAMSAYVLSTGDKNVLVDTVVGDWVVEGFPPPEAPSPFLRRLREAGFEPEDIDVVVNTHLHLDHVGWNTRQLADGTIVPTFPRAQYLFVREEWDDADQHGHDNPAFATVDRAVRPVFEAGRATLVERDHRLTAEISLFPTPGHTAGHVSVQIVTDAGEGLIIGDMMHHPIQLFEPACSTYDWDVAESLRSRELVVERLQRRGALVLGTHFVGTGVGRLERSGASGYRYVQTA